MTLSRLCLTTILTLTGAVAASAQATNGLYQLSVGSGGSEETIVRLENNVLTFYESVCTLANPVPIDGTQGFSYVGNCAGEGLEWQANMMIIPLEGGQVMRMIRDGSIFDYAYCGP